VQTPKGIQQVGARGKRRDNLREGQRTTLTSIVIGGGNAPGKGAVRWCDNRGET